MSASVEHPRKRRRPALNCQQCRDRKVKCDRESPCGACIRQGTAEECTLASSRVHGDNIATRTDQVFTRALSSHEQDRFPERTSNRHPNLPDDHVSDRSFDRIQELETSVGALSTEVRRLQQLVSRSSETHASPSSGKIVSPPSARLRVSSEKTRYYGPSHFVHALTHLEVLQRYKTGESTTENHHDMNQPQATLTPELVDNVRDIKKLRYALKNQRRVTDFDPHKPMSTLLPSREVGENLLQLYLETLEPIYRIPCMPDFRKAFVRCWSNPDAVQSSSLVAILLVFSIGSTFYDGQDANHVRSLARHWFYAAQWWLIGPDENSVFSYQGVQIRCLLLLSQQVLFIGKVGSALTTSGSLLQHAMSLGLHRDPDHFKNLSIKDAELRRRLWETVVELVLQVSIDSSLPPLIRWGDFDTEGPKNVSDESLETGECLPDHVWTGSSIQVLLYKSRRLRMEVASFISEPDRDRSYERANILAVQLEAACAGLNPPKQSTSASPPDAKARWNEFQSKFLMLIHHKLLMLLNRPFMLESKNDRRLHFSRMRAVDSARTMVSLYGVSEDSIAPHDRFQTMSNKGAGIFKSSIGTDVVATLSAEIMLKVNEMQLDPTAFDTRFEMERTRSFIKTVSNVKEALEALIGAGEPSLQRYLLLSCSLAHYLALLNGASPILYVQDALQKGLEMGKRHFERHLTEPLQESSNTKDSDHETTGALQDSTTEAAGFDQSTLQHFDQDLNLPVSWLFSMWNDESFLI